MTSFKLMCFDFGFPRTSDTIRLSVFHIRDYVEDYMRINHFERLKLFMSQCETIPYEYQFDCYLQDGFFWTERHLNQEGATLND